MKSFLLKPQSLYGGFVYVLNFCIGLLTVNTYAPLTEGWWHVYARWIDQGRVPYKDFELLVTPGFPYITWLFKHIAGEEFLHLRIVGLFFQAGIALLLYLILSKHISSLTSIGLSTFGTTLLYSGTASISFDYNYFAVFFATLTIFFLQKDYAKHNIYLYLAGISLSGVFLIKQSTGLCLLLSISFIPILDKRFIRIVKVLLWLKFYIAFLLPIILFLSCLIVVGAFTQMIEQVFFSSSEVKGGLVNILTQWIEGIYEPYSFGYAIRNVLFFGIIVFVIMRIRNQTSFPLNVEKYQLAFTLIISLFIAGETIRSRFSSSENIFRNYLEDLYLKASTFFYLEPILLILFILLWVLRDKKYEWLPILMLSIAMTYSTGMSAGLTEYGIFVNIIVVIAWFDKFLNIRFLNYLILIFSLIFSSTLILKKFETPYSWWGYSTSSIYKSTFTSTIGLTKGLKFSENEFREFQEVSNRINQLECQGEVIGYPHMPLFALDSNRLPKGKTAVYWYDFIRQSALLQESERLKANRFSAIIRMNTREAATQHQKLFYIPDSNGRLSMDNLVEGVFSKFNSYSYPMLGIEMIVCPN